MRTLQPCPYSSYALASSLKGSSISVRKWAETLVHTEESFTVHVPCTILADVLTRAFWSKHNQGLVLQLIWKNPLLFTQQPAEKPPVRFTLSLFHKAWSPPFLLGSLLQLAKMSGVASD